MNNNDETREEFIARAVKNSGYTPEAAAYQWDSSQPTKCPTCEGDGKDRDSAMADVACVICSGTGIDPDTEYDVDGVYTAKDLAADIVRIFNQFHREGDTATLNMILEHIQEYDLLPKRS